MVNMSDFYRDWPVYRDKILKKSNKQCSKKISIKNNIIKTNLIIIEKSISILSDPIVKILTKY
jgi:hypothetical protein